MVKLFIVIILLLAIIAVAQLMRVLELSGQLRNKKEEDISASDTKMNANLMLVFMVFFFGGFIWLLARYGNGGLGIAASEHGQDTDWLLKINFYIIIAVFFITNTLLFYFPYKYHYKKDRKALYFPHNNKLEMLWTVVPACVLAVIIILGLKTWNEITANSPDEATRIELYSKQFEWVARYSGTDNQLGHSDFRLVDSDNPLGILTKVSLDSTIARMDREIAALQDKLKRADSALVASDVITDDAYDVAKARMQRMQRHKKKVLGLLAIQNAELDKKANDDKVIKLKEIHLLVNHDYEFLMRSQDVIHSAYMPHFRIQMNTVPGMTTRMKFKPIITTDSMRTIRNDPAFDYILLCNKICGSAHYNMQMKIVVDKKDAYLAWLKEQKTFLEERMPATAETTDSTTTVADTTATLGLVAPVANPNNGQ